MNKDEYLDLFYSSDVAESFEETYNFFSHYKVNMSDLDEDCFSDQILATYEYLDDENKHEDMITFINMLQEKQTALFDSLKIYFVEFMVPYYCSKELNNGLIHVFNTYFEDIKDSFDEYVNAIYHLMCYNQSEVLEIILDERLPNLLSNDDIMDDLSMNMSIMELLQDKLMLDINNTYISESKSYNLDKVNELISNSPAEDKEHIANAINYFTNAETIDHKTLAEKFEQSHKELEFTILFLTLQYLRKYDFGISLAHIITLNYIDIKWLVKEIILKQHINLTKEAQKQSIKNIRKYFFTRFQNFEVSEYNVEQFVVVWGGAYFFEFLNSIGFISSEYLKDVLEIFAEMKALLIVNYADELWTCDFVHKWHKPDCISEKEFEVESRIFQKTKQFRGYSFNEFQHLISDELVEMPEFKKRFTDAIKKIKTESKPSIFDKMLKNTEMNSYSSNDDSRFDGFPKPIKAEYKPGRNEPCPCGSGKKYKKCCGQS